jgi:hypothetical protein
MQEIQPHIQYQQHYHHENQGQYPLVNEVDNRIAIAPSTTHQSHPAMDLNFLTWNQGTSVPNPPTWDTAWPAQDLFSIDETISTTSQMDILFSLESFFGNGYGG